MNWHFLFFLFDVIGWIGIAVLLCSRTFIKKSDKVNLNNIIKLSIIMITLCAGLLSVLINGIPDTGFSIKSFMYAFFVSFTLVYYLRTKIKKEYLPKIGNRDRKVAYG